MAPSVVTLLAGANDFFVFLATSGVPQDPFTVIPGVANYYSFEHPDPQVEFLLDLALETFRASLVPGSQAYKPISPKRAKTLESVKACGGIRKSRCSASFNV